MTLGFIYGMYIFFVTVRKDIDLLNDVLSLSLTVQKT